MKLGYIGLGKMGFNMVERLLEKGHEVVAHDTNSDSVVKIVDRGAECALTLSDVVERLTQPRLIWIMVPHMAVEGVLSELVPLLEQGDVIIDGGNSPYKESVRRAKELAERGIGFLDVGVSGGPSGARNGACLMVGGERGIYNRYSKLFGDLAVENGYAYLGNSGAGHFVKMVHNGVEYGMMQAIAEGFEIMRKSGFMLDLTSVASVYNNGSVVESRLIGWLGEAYEKFGSDLNGTECCSGEVAHSGEGQWTVDEAHELGVPADVIEGALQFRKRSLGNPSYTGQVLSAMRNQFGGHKSPPSSEQTKTTQ